MIAPRWRKVLADLWGSKVRSSLLILTIAVGVFAVGFNIGLGDLISSDMDADFQASNGHSGILYTDYFNDDLVAALRHVPGVAAVQGRSAISGRALITKDNKFPIQVASIPPLAQVQIDRLWPLNAEPLPPLKHHEIYVADSGVGTLKVVAGDSVTVELADGSTRTLRVAAIAHDVNAIPASFGSAIMAYSDSATLEWLGGSQDYNQVYFTVQTDATDKAHVTQVAEALTNKIEASGRTVYSTFIYNPGRHFAKDIFQAVAGVLDILAGLSVFLSTFLIINIITALLTQHIRFIGVMKALGGRQSQIVIMYLALVLCFGVLALAITVWPSALASQAVAQGMGSYLNFAVQPFRFSPLAVALQLAIGLLVPILAAVFPILNGTRLTVREAISNYGLGKGRFGTSWLDRLVSAVRFLSRPLLISLRNTFRRKARLVLTLSTLTLAGAIFISVFNLWTAFDQVIDQIKGYFLADVNVQLAHNYRFSQIENLLTGIPGLQRVEGWSLQSADLMASDKKSSIPIAFVAPPNDTQLLEPILLAGRWLLPTDQNAIVIGNHVLKEFPALKVGDTLITRVNEQDYPWVVVGVFKMAGNTNPALVYVNHDYLAQSLSLSGQVGTLRMVTSPSDPATQTLIAHRLETVFQRNNIEVSQVTTGDTWRQQQSGQFDVMIYFLLIMALLIAVVGGLGLMGTMSMNVLERSREIGVLRAVGASNGAILQMILAEGLLIGLLSWAFALVVSIPITYILNAGVGASILSAPLDFTFSLNGLVIWLGLVIVIAALASALPAWNAMRLTVREVLSYE